MPTHDLRNGRLNQAAYSLFLFMRDIADGDFVGWIDHRLSQPRRSIGCQSKIGIGEAPVDPDAERFHWISMVGGHEKSAAR